MNIINEQNALSLLKELIQIPSYIGLSNPNSEKLMAEYLNNWIKDNLKDYKLVEIPYDKERKNLLYKTNSNKILYACHMDTIPPQKESGLRLTVKGDKVYGLGTKDMKGGIVSMLLALKELEAIDIEHKASILFYGDEEYSQKGMKTLVEKSKVIPKPQLIISPESRFNIGYGARGVCVIKFSVSGKTAHSARPHLGINAIQIFYKTYSALCKKLSEKTELGKSDVTITEISGGLLLDGKLSSQSNMIPDFASGVISIRLAQTDISSKNIQDTVREVVVNHNGKVENLEILNDYPAYLGSKTTLRIIINAIKKVGLKVNYAEPTLAGYNDAALLSHKLGVPIINFGPYGENNHSPDEWVSIKSIVDTAKVFFNLMSDL